MQKLNSLPLISVVVATKNEENNIANCLRSIINQQYPKDRIEIIVVDNYSSDDTVKIANKYADKVYIKGPQRASQLNYGVNKSNGKYILFPDADMILSRGVSMSCINTCETKGHVAIYIPERIIGKGFWIKIRDFERSFYNSTSIDSVRFVRRDAFLRVGGYDESLYFGPDDWDFDRRIKNIGESGVIGSCLYHNEGNFNIKKYLNKKKEYSKTLYNYVKKWGKDDVLVVKQLGIRYRLLGVFIENGKWKKLIRNPVKTFGMYLLRFMVGIIYLSSILSLSILIQRS